MLLLSGNITWAGKFMAADVRESLQSLQHKLFLQKVDRNTREKEKNRREGRGRKSQVRERERLAKKTRQSTRPPKIPEIRPPKRKNWQGKEKKNVATPLHFVFPLFPFSYPVATRFVRKMEKERLQMNIRKLIALRARRRRLSLIALCGRCSRSADLGVPLPRP